MVDSDHPRAITVSGGACMNATYMGTVGDYVNNGNANASCMSGQEIAVNLDTALYPDGASGFTTNPLEQYTPTEPVPDPAGTDIVGTNISVGDGDVVQLLPGRYNGSTTTTIDPVTLLPVTTTSEAIRVTGGIAYFAPGLYVLDSGMRFTGGMIRISADGGGTVSSQAGHPGASFYFTENTYDSDSNWKFLTITGAANVKLYAPATGEYAGWLFWENDLAPDNSPGHRIIGTSDSEMVGIIAFPTRDLFWGGTSTVSDWVMIVVDNLTIAGGAFIPTGGINDSAIPNPLETVTLLE